MVDVRSEVKDVRIERRAHPRLELHCRATVPGLKGLQTLTDISLGGCFIQAKIPGKVKIGQLITFKTKLPTERSEITVRARVVNQTQRGIGCQFIALQEETKDAICLCFEMFKDTLPVGAQREQWAKECSPKAPESPALKSEPAASAPPKPPAPKSRAPKPPSPESPAPASIRTVC